MLKTALVALGARSTEIVVVAQFVAIFSLLDILQNGWVDGDGGI